MNSETNAYHYTECGLPNVWIQGAHAVDDAGEETIRIPNIRGLHRLIANAIVECDGRLTGAEMRFLRSEMGMTQTALARLVHRTRLTLSRWEREESAVDGAADALIRIFATYRLGLESVDENELEEISARCIAKPNAKSALWIDGSIPGSYRLAA
ncbi:MAG: helix-turn-helix domain-containing protein [Gammaproteobacteria bacterium]|nr:helix-turn-helix domain-containing protein [Gammaproteobacteria bacterium]